MDTETRLEIFKTQQLADLFAAMNDEVKLRVVSAGFGKAAKVILDATKANLPAATKAAKRFSKQLGAKLTKGQFEMSVGMKKKGIGAVAHLIEGGTVERYYRAIRKNPRFNIRRGDIQRTGKMTGQHFFDQAINTTEPQVNEELYQYICNAFVRLVDKYEKGK